MPTVELLAGPLQQAGPRNLVLYHLGEQRSLDVLMGLHASRAAHLQVEDNHTHSVRAVMQLSTD
jgi:hypothetical protein